MIFIHRFIWF